MQKEPTKLKKKVLKKRLGDDAEMVQYDDGKRNRGKETPSLPMPRATPTAKLTVLTTGIRYPSGVSKAQMIEAFAAVLYVAGKKLTMRVKDLYAALLNRVRPYCNMYDLLPYQSSTKDPSIRKKLEFTMGDLRRAGYLSPKNPEKTVTLLKVIPPGLKL